MISYLRGAWYYWKGQWDLAWSTADIAYDLYMGTIQGALENAGVVKPVPDDYKPPAWKRFASRAVRHFILSALVGWWLGLETGLRLLFVLTLYNGYKTGVEQRG